MLPTILLTSPGVLQAAVSTTGPKALVASDVASRLFSSRAVNVVRSVLVPCEVLTSELRAKFWKSAVSISVP